MTLPTTNHALVIQGSEEETNTWTDQKGRKVSIMSMSDKWLNNIRKKFNGDKRKNIQPIMDEIKRRKELRSNKNLTNTKN